MTRKGFTLVELLVVTVILSIALVVLYSGFRSGLAAYTRTEENLADRRDGEIFLLQFEQELKSAVPYAQAKEQGNNEFVGKKDSILFPARLRHYTAKGVEENIYVVRYDFKSDSLIRTERKLKSKSLKEKEELKETLFEKLKTCRFEYLYLDSSEKFEWTNEWLNNPYVGLPRAVRLTLAGDAFGREERTFEILIPHGVLLKRYS